MGSTGKRMACFVSIMMVASAILCFVAVSAVTGQEPKAPSPQAAPAAGEKAKSAESDHPRVTMKTSMGEIVLELDRKRAPVTVENFLRYTKDGFYNGTVFHRVIPDFMIQGGGMEPGMKKKPTRSPIKNEATNGLKNKTGTIAMARTSMSWTAQRGSSSSTARTIPSWTIGTHRPGDTDTPCSARWSREWTWCGRSKRFPRVRRGATKTCRWKIS